ncbi:MAG: hypothetical protein HZC43_06050 [Nitrosomonadales bacterium]|nr:hypothetical protein [Nitrosomonadales bacterium]
MNTAHKTFMALLGIGLAALIGNSALAGEHRDGARAEARQNHPARHGVDAREHRQHQRINRGVRSGQLTREETRDLAAQQREIRQKERQYRSDGKFTKEERKDVQQDLNQASKDIYREKHDGETRK